MISWLKDGFRSNTWWSRLLFTGLLPLFGLLYPMCSHLAANTGRFMIWQFPIDDLIPFNRIFILAYYYWYVQIGFGVVWLVTSSRTGRLLHRMIVTLILSNIIAAIFFLTMPTFMIRPEVAGTDFLSQMVRFIYKIDLPYNCFPSMHVFWATIIARFWALAGPRKTWFRLINYTGLILIILSTVFTKQHYSPDILGGLALAWVCCRLSDYLFSRYLSPRFFPEDPRHISHQGVSTLAQ